MNADGHRLGSGSASTGPSVLIRVNLWLSPRLVLRGLRGPVGQCAFSSFRILHFASCTLHLDFPAPCLCTSVVNSYLASWALTRPLTCHGS